MKLWALVDFTDTTGQRHTKGSQFTLPINTPDQQAYANSLIRYGIATATMPANGVTT